MADIPFEKQPAPGFYDTSGEQAKRVAAPTGKTLRELEGGKRKQDRAEDDAREKKRKAREAKDKDADAMSHFVPSKDALLQQRREEQQISKRRKLTLPSPQVSERELEDLVKIGKAGESARGLVDENGNEASQGLLGEYSALGDARNSRTPRTAPQRTLPFPSSSLPHLTFFLHRRQRSRRSSQPPQPHRPANSPSRRGKHPPPRAPGSHRLRGCYSSRIRGRYSQPPRHSLPLRRQRCWSHPRLFRRRHSPPHPDARQPQHQRRRLRLRSYSS